MTNGRMTYTLQGQKLGLYICNHARLTYIETQFYIPREYGILVLLDIYFSDHVPDIFR